MERYKDKIIIIFTSESTAQNFGFGCMLFLGISFGLLH